MLNKSHPLSRYKANSGKNKECLMHFDPDARAFVLSLIDTRYNVCDKFSSVILSV